MPVVAGSRAARHDRRVTCPKPALSLIVLPHGARRALLALLLAASPLGCAECEPAPVLPPCEEGLLPEATHEPLGRATLLVDDDVEPALLSTLGAILEELGGAPPTVVHGPPTDAAPLDGLALWVSSSAAAQASAGAVPTDGYRLVRLAPGAAPGLPQGAILATARAPRDLAHAGAALLETLGVRFFHPERTHVPAGGRLRVPRAVDVTRTPAYAVRGVQLHLLHPTELYASFFEPSPEHLAEALRLVDWLVHTGQNHLQVFLLDNLDEASWPPHMEAIIEYAHARGVTVGAVVQLWGGASLQNALSLVVENEAQASFDELDASLERLMRHPWDLIELAMGEFFGNDPAVVLAWLDHATETVAARWPGTDLSVVNHVGNYPALWVELAGEELFYYHVPGKADARLINNVHTVFWYDLYRPHGMYGHPDFALHRDFMLEQLAVRRMRYLPESAYWITADIDVPVFLPEYLRSRHIDATGLVRDARAAGLPAVEGHVMFTSGHEWGYWMTDALTARMLWEEDGAQPALEDVVAHATSIHGGCAPEVQAAVLSVMDAQREALFEKDLVPFASAEDLHDDLGDATGFLTQIPRVPFEAVAAMPERERETFRATLEEVSETARRHREALAALRAVQRRADDAMRPWIDELVDGVEVTALKLEHAVALYQAVLAGFSEGGDTAALLEPAVLLRTEAAAVIARREASYRYDPARLTGSALNRTRYPFGLYAQAHTQCLWRRQEEQVRFLLDSGIAASPFTLPTCQG
jgi:hypothetical protein